MSSGSTVVSTQRSQGNCIFLNIKWNLLKRVFTNHLKFFFLFVWYWGEWGGRWLYFYLSLAIFFPLLPSVDQVWLVHYFGAISSSLTLLEAADALEILSPTKGQDTLLPWGHDLCSISRSSDCLSCSWNCFPNGNAICCLRPAK